MNTCYAELSHWFEPYSHTSRWSLGSCDPVFVVGWRGHHHSRYSPCRHWQGLKNIRDSPASAPGRQDTKTIIHILRKHPLNHSTILFIPSTYTNISLWRSRVREWKYTQKHPLFEEGWGEVGKRVVSVWKEGIEEGLKHQWFVAPTLYLWFSRW